MVFIGNYIFLLLQIWKLWREKNCHFKALNIPKFIIYLFIYWKTSMWDQLFFITKIHKQILKYLIGHLTNCFWVCNHQLPAFNLLSWLLNMFFIKICKKIEDNTLNYYLIKFTKKNLWGEKNFHPGNKRLIKWLLDFLFCYGTDSP